MEGAYQLTQSDFTISCSLSDTDYTIAVLEKEQLIFSQHKIFTPQTLSQMPLSLGKEIERLELIGAACQLLLMPGQYQLITMDALNVPDAEMAKALRWKLKGLTHYPLDDLAIDVFPMPNPGMQKKVFVALTPLSTLKKWQTLLESAYLELQSASIADMTLKNIFHSKINAIANMDESAPVIILSQLGQHPVYKLNLIYQGLFYLIRELPPNSNPEALIDFANIIAEVERSIDYCVNTLTLPSPKCLVFTPGFQEHVDLSGLKEVLKMDCMVIDINEYIHATPPMNFTAQQAVFYNILGALQ